MITPFHHRIFAYAFRAARETLSLIFCLLYSQFNCRFLLEAFPELFGKSISPVVGALSTMRFSFISLIIVVVSHLFINFD